MLGHMQKVTPFEHKLKKPKMWVRTVLLRTLQLIHSYVTLSILTIISNMNADQSK